MLKGRSLPEFSCIFQVQYRNEYPSQGTIKENSWGTVGKGSSCKSESLCSETRATGLPKLKSTELPTVNKVSTAISGLQPVTVGPTFSKPFLLNPLHKGCDYESGINYSLVGLLACFSNGHRCLMAVGKSALRASPSLPLSSLWKYLSHSSSGREDSSLPSLFLSTWPWWIRVGQKVQLGFLFSNVSQKIQTAHANPISPFTVLFFPIQDHAINKEFQPGAPNTERWCPSMVGVVFVPRV